MKNGLIRNEGCPQGAEWFLNKDRPLFINWDYHKG